MWWSIAIGGSMLVSAVSQLIETSLAVSESLDKNNQNPSSDQHNNYIHRSGSSYGMVRVSKYPSRTTIGFPL